MSKWKTVRLEDVCTINMGQSPDSSSYNQEGSGIPFYQGNADFGDLHPVTRFYCSQPIKIARKGDILISVRAPIGAINIATETCCIGRGLAALTAIADQLDTKYLFYVLSYKNNELNNKGTGSTFKAISKQTLSEVKLPLPPLESQRKIAKTLDTVSEILAMRKQQLAELDNLIKSIFFDMFGDPVTNEKGWSIHKLGEVCDVRDGTHDSPNYVESGYPLVTSKNVRNGEISLDDVSYISYEDYCEINKRSKVDKGDIIMPMIGTIGNPAIVKHDAPSFAIKNVALIKFPIPSRIGNLYLKELLTLDFFTIITQKRSRGGTQKFIALGDIRNLEIPVPPINIQSGFENKVTIIESVKEKVTLALDEIQYLFDSIMSRYFY